MWWRILLAIGLALAAYATACALLWVWVEALGPDARAFTSEKWAEPFAASLDELSGFLWDRPAWPRGIVVGLAQAVRSYPQLAPLLTFAIPVGLPLARLLYLLVNWLTRGPPTWLSQKGLRRRRSNRTPRLVEAQILDQLLEFADADPPQAPVRAFYGVFGSDKAAVRGLAQDWMRTLRRRGWQVGALSGDIPDLWETRKRTAIVVDCEDAVSLQNRLRELSEALSEQRGAKVRILFCSSADLPAAPQEPAADPGLNEVWSTLYRARGARSDAASTVTREDGSSASRDGDASQRSQVETPTTHFIYLPARHPRLEAQALVDRANKSFGVEGVQLLTLCALFDALPSHVRAELLPQTGDKEKLGAIFQMRWDRLKHSLPPLRELRSDVLALCLDRLPRSDRERLLARIGDRYGDGVIDTLNELLEDLAFDGLVEALEDENAHAGTPSGDKLATLRAAFEAFDANGALRRAFPAHFDALVEDAFDEFISAARLRLQLQITKWGQSEENKAEAEGLQEKLAALPKDLSAPEGEHQPRSRGQDGLTPRRQGALLGRCIQALLPYNPVDALGLLMRRLEAIAPAMMEALTVNQRRELLLALAEARPVMSLRDDLKLLADEDIWLACPVALRRLLEMLFDWQIARMADQLPKALKAAFPEGLTSTEARGVSHPVFDLALRGAAFVGEIPLDPEEHTPDWEDRAGDAEPLLLELLDSQDKVTCYLGCLAAFWLAGAVDDRPALAPLSEATVARLLGIAESARAPGPTWRRAIDVLTKLAGAPLPETPIYAWAVAADTGGEPPELERVLKMDASRLEGAAAEARHRLADPMATPAVRSSAGLFLLTLETASEFAADAVASGIKATTWDLRRDWMLAKLAQAGPVYSRRALLDLARGPAGSAAYRAKLGLVGIRARDLIHAHLPELDPTGALALRAIADSAPSPTSSPS